VITSNFYLQLKNIRSASFAELSSSSSSTQSLCYWDFVSGFALDSSSRIFEQEMASFRAYLRTKIYIFPSISIHSSW